MELLNSRTYNYCIIIIFIVAFFLRLYDLGAFPIDPDELSNIYDGYSIAETGADRWGEKYPLILRGFGKLDNRPSLYAWLCALSIKTFGYSIIAGRLPSAIICCLSLLFMYLTALKIAGRKYALLALLLAALMPWHIFFSRLGHEGANLTPFFVILVLYLWIRNKENNYGIAATALLGLCTGLATNGYQSAKLIFLFVAILIVIDIFRRTASFTKMLVYIITTGIGVLPQLIVVVQDPGRFFSRADDTMMEFSFSLNYFRTLFDNIFAGLSPDYLFFSFNKINNLSIGRLLAVECIFFYIGLIMIRKVVKETSVLQVRDLYLLLLIVIMPAALTHDNPHALRASGMMVLTPFFSAAGICYLSSWISKPTIQRIFFAAIVLLVIVNGVCYVGKYSRRLQEHGYDREKIDIAMVIAEYNDKYHQILLDNHSLVQYIYIAHYSGIHPQEFQTMELVYNDEGWDRFVKMGKYSFLGNEDIKQCLNEKGPRTLGIINERIETLIALDSFETSGMKYFLYSNAGK